MWCHMFPSLAQVMPSLQNKIWNLPDRSTILPKFIYIYIWYRRKACRTDPNFAGQCQRSGTYFEDWMPASCLISIKVYLYQCTSENLSHIAKWTFFTCIMFHSKHKNLEILFLTFGFFIQRVVTKYHHLLLLVLLCNCPSIHIILVTMMNKSVKKITLPNLLDDSSMVFSWMVLHVGHIDLNFHVH